MNAVQQSPRARTVVLEATDAAVSSYSVRALEAIPGRHGLAMRLHPPGSRADFLQALEILAGNFAVQCPNGRDARWEQAMIFVNCPYHTWLHVFGKPRAVEDHYDLFTQGLFETWAHFCEDGFATCTGHISQRAPDGRWVTVGMVRLHKPLPVRMQESVRPVEASSRTAAGLSREERPVHRSLVATASVHAHPPRRSGQDHAHNNFCVHVSGVPDGT